MIAVTAIKRARRALVFASYMPTGKLARRAELTVRRRLRDVWPDRGVANAAALPRRDEVPSAVFAPRLKLAPTLDEDATVFHFLNLSVSMATAEGVRAIDWNAPGAGSAHQLWRMNLHYMEYLEGLDDANWAAFVHDWLAHNGTNRPGAWRDSWNSYALSLRVVVWMQEMARRGGRLPRQLCADVDASLAVQIRFLTENLETDLGGNHLIKNIKALIWASAYFDGSEADHWGEVGLQLLARELDRQVLLDGMHDERSPSYHCQVFADLLECRHVVGANVLDGALDDALTRMAQATADLAHPDGRVAQFNDAGLSMAYAPDECIRIYERLTGENVRAASTFSYPNAGYFGLRANGFYVVCDCGRIGPDDLPAHGHSDVLSFELSAFGERFIVDQGVFEYVAGPRRERARRAANHNTLSLEGVDQADFFGAFRCGRRPNVTVRELVRSDSALVVEGSHDGYAHLPGRPVHVRRFELTPGKLAISDQIDGSYRGQARIGFLLHPDVVATVDGTRLKLERECGTLLFTSNAPLELETAVWWPDMGVEHATSRIVVAEALAGSRLAVDVNITDITSGAPAGDPVT